ncbi:metallophosphoesterase [bacterium]|nr:metallophosphoesterase [bacterium]
MPPRQIVKFAFFADSHIGFDSVSRPRIERRRRDADFFANYISILKYAKNRGLDFIVHGGDLFYRSKISTNLVMKAFEPLFDLADCEIPVYLVPGNHERGAIPYRLIAEHPGINIFDFPQTFVFHKGKSHIALGGFPYTKNIRENFINTIRQTGLFETKANYKILCMHQIVEGTTVGPKNFTFR